LPFEIVTGIRDPGGGITDGGYRSKRVACSIIKVGLLAVSYFYGSLSHGQFDETSAARNAIFTRECCGKPHAPERNIVKLLDGLIFASA
jgi:hypothetical protein